MGIKIYFMISIDTNLAAKEINTCITKLQGKLPFLQPTKLHLGTVPGDTVWKSAVPPLQKFSDKRGVSASSWFTCKSKETEAWDNGQTTKNVVNKAHMRCGCRQMRKLWHDAECKDLVLGFPSCCKVFLSAFGWEVIPPPSSTHWLVSNHPSVVQWSTLSACLQRVTKYQGLRPGAVQNRIHQAMHKISWKDSVFLSCT
jgi:hypothetical protein